jgi:membrane-bound lytic murein transglycosylase D
MKRFKPLALALSLLAVTVPVARAADGAISRFASVDQGLAAGLDMMLLNTSLLRNGDNVWERLREGFQMQEVNSELVKSQIRYYARRPDLLKRTLGRSHKYLFYILNEVERRGMPTEIALLPMVESSFLPNATSPVGAAGLWQFMPMTGRHYGLEQTWWYDGRRDVTAATNAALDYLQTLYAQFGDWSLALAAYNWGEGNLARSIARTEAAGLPVTYENIRMPAETRSYVPKLLAIRDLLTDPASYGVKLDKFPNKPYFVAVKADHHMDIALAARLAGITVDEFKALNPAFNLPVYAYKEGRQMLLPANRVQRFEANLAKWDKPLLTWQVYTPNSSDTANQIADRAGMSITQFMSVNHLNGATLQPGRPVLVAMKGNDDGDIRNLMSTDTPDLASDQPATLTAENTVTNAAPTPVADNRTPPRAAVSQPVKQQAVIQVALAEPAPVVTKPVAPTATPASATAQPPVAAVTVEPPPLQVAAASPTLSETQPVAMRLPVAEPVRPAASVTRIAMADSIPQMAQALASVHVVSPGDTLYNISRRYNLSVSELRAINNLPGSTLRTGQVLQLKRRFTEQSAEAGTPKAQSQSGATAIPAEYVVQRGDTIYSIARRFGVERSEIIRLNGTRQLARLQPGQVVKIQGL